MTRYMIEHPTSSSPPFLSTVTWYRHGQVALLCFACAYMVSNFVLMDADGKDFIGEEEEEKKKIRRCVCGPTQSNSNPNRLFQKFRTRVKND